MTPKRPTIKQTPIPKVMLLVGKDSITLAVPELREETVAMILADAHSLCQRLEGLAARCRAMCA